VSEIATTVIAALTGTTVAAAILAWLLSKWLGVRIESSIKYEYDRLKADRENDLKRRERAQLIAELLAEWLATGNGAPMTQAQRTKLNRLSFECTLWLPEDVAKELSRVLQHDPQAPNRFDLLLKVRALLSGPHSLTVKHITQWDSSKELENYGLPPEFVHGQLTVRSVAQEEDGDVTPISLEEVGAVFAPVRARALHLQVIHGQRDVLVRTADIEALKLVAKTMIGDRLEQMRLEVFPKSLADDINRNLHGAVKQAVVERVPEGSAPASAT
jgi:hypothetical protein